ncbi:MAG: CpXC domain-containing protein [Anaerolineales bacterium]|nr:CpXC domain-containing protein [Anaerolineales bacterium]
MPRTRINCPNCRQPIAADLDQLFDVQADPSAKQRFLSGAFNIIQCPNCGYQGNLATPLVYHDPDKELLLTYVPSELGIPRDEQERIIGGLMNQIINTLPMDKRKGYLLNPVSAFTLQGMIERVLEGEGITHEMIQAQQQRMALLRRLANASDESVRADIAHQEENLIDAQFFGILGRLIEAAMSGGDQESAQHLAELQKSLLSSTAYGRELQSQAQEVQSTINELRAMGKDLTREKLLDLIISAASETRLNVLVSLTRPAMDYNFFQLLSDRIDQASGDEKNRLLNLRSQLLEMTQEIDHQIEERVKEIRTVIEALLQAPDLEQAVAEILPAVDEMFMQELQSALQESRKAGDLERSAKLNKIGETIQKAGTPPEMMLIQEYLDAPDETARQKFLDEHSDEINPEFMEMLGNISAQVQQSNEEPEIVKHVVAANRQALRYTMQRNLRSNS